ncbi:MAG: division/cell wall cluster transcriptional repressor MraZ [bacterium]|nr:division/cell wall cluster transcriptional repressor MraZ [bacterium]MDZ4296496.1 division/cell wall cluster transcriptional repressor MraZ [Patescibacteria group bacterium]
MLIGQYQHALDEKKRLAIPSKLRLEVGHKVVVTRGLDKCLFIYPMPIWERIAEKLGELPVGKSETRQFLRVLLSGATEVELDSLGRILIPEFLKTYAGLEKEAVIVGVYNRLEVWDEREWADYRVEAEKNQDAIAEKLGEVGVY